MRKTIICVMLCPPLYRAGNFSLLSGHPFSSPCLLAYCTQILVPWPVEYHTCPCNLAFFSVLNPKKAIFAHSHLNLIHLSSIEINPPAALWSIPGWFCNKTSHLLSSYYFCGVLSLSSSIFVTHGACISPTIENFLENFIAINGFSKLLVFVRYLYS